MQNRSKNLLVKKAKSISKLLDRVDYVICWDSSSSDINALYHSGRAEFKNAQPILDLMEQTESLVKLILEEADEHKN